MWDKGLARLNALRGERGLEPLEHFFDQIRQRRVASSCSRRRRSTSPLGSPEPTCATSGRCSTTRRGSSRASCRRATSRSVLVALSSTFQDHAACLQRIVTALGTLPVRGLLTTGPALDPASVRAPANVKVVRSAPHAHVLEHASAVVTHGGHGTVIKSLAAGVPLVVMAHGRDQADNAKRVTTRGAGIARSAAPRRTRSRRPCARCSNSRATGRRRRRSGAASAAMPRTAGSSTNWRVTEAATGSPALPSRCRRGRLK